MFAHSSPGAHNGKRGAGSMKPLPSRPGAAGTEIAIGSNSPQRALRRPQEA